MSKVSCGNSIIIKKKKNLRKEKNLQNLILMILKIIIIVQRKIQQINKKKINRCQKLNIIYMRNLQQPLTQLQDSKLCKESIWKVKNINLIQ